MSDWSCFWQLKSKKTIRNEKTRYLSKNTLNALRKEKEIAHLLQEELNFNLSDWWSCFWQLKNKTNNNKIKNVMFLENLNALRKEKDHTSPTGRIINFNLSDRWSCFWQLKSKIILQKRCLSKNKQKIKINHISYGKN